MHNAVACTERLAYMEIVQVILHQSRGSKATGDLLARRNSVEDKCLAIPYPTPQAGPSNAKEANTKAKEKSKPNDTV